MMMMMTRFCYNYGKTWSGKNWSGAIGSSSSCCNNDYNINNNCHSFKERRNHLDTNPNNLRLVRFHRVRSICPELDLYGGPPNEFGVPSVE